MFDFFTGGFFEDGTKTDVVFCRKGVLGEVLEEGSDGVAVLVDIVGIDVLVVYEDFAFFRLIEAAKEFDKGAFTGTIDTDNSNVVGGVDPETDAF